MELKWALAIGFEAAFWLMLAAFLVLRYRFEIESVTRLFVIGVVLDTAGHRRPRCLGLRCRRAA